MWAGAGNKKLTTKFQPRATQDMKVFLAWPTNQDKEKYTLLQSSARVCTFLLSPGLALRKTAKTPSGISQGFQMFVFNDPFCDTNVDPCRSHYMADP